MSELEAFQGPPHPPKTQTLKQERDASATLSTRVAELEAFQGPAEEALKALEEAEADSLNSHSLIHSQ